MSSNGEGPWGAPGSEVCLSSGFKAGTLNLDELGKNQARAREINNEVGYKQASPTSHAAGTMTVTPAYEKALTFGVRAFFVVRGL